MWNTYSHIVQCRLWKLRGITLYFTIGLKKLSSLLYIYREVLSAIYVAIKNK